MTNKAIFIVLGMGFLVNGIFNKYDMYIPFLRISHTKYPNQSMAIGVSIIIITLVLGYLKKKDIPHPHDSCGDVDEHSEH